MINSSQLLKVLNIVKSSLSKDSTLVLSCFLIESGGEVLNITATDLTTSTKTTIHNYDGEPFPPILVDSQEFIKALKSIKGNVSLACDRYFTYLNIVSANGFTAKLKIGNAANYPTIPVAQENITSYIVDRKVFLPALQRATNVTSSEIDRPALNGVHVQSCRDLPTLVHTSLILTGADGYAIHSETLTDVIKFANYSQNIGKKHGGAFIIPANLAKIIIKAFGNAAPNEHDLRIDLAPAYDHDHNHSCLATFQSRIIFGNLDTTFVITGGTTDAKYPDIKFVLRPVWPNWPVSSFNKNLGRYFKFDIAQLLSALSHFNFGKKEQTPYVLFNLDDYENPILSNFIETAQVNIKDAISHITPAIHDTNGWALSEDTPGRLALNANLLRPILSGASELSKSATFYQVSRTDAVYIVLDDKPDAFLAIMPIRY